MMRIVEQSSNHLRLSNADAFWIKWGFVAIIVVALLGGIFIAAKTTPACWSGVIVGCLLLFMLVRELPNSFDTEFWFDRAGDQLNVIKRPWLGRPQVEHYPLSDITEVRLVERARPRRYPGQDYDDAENQAPIESPQYDVQLNMRSGSPLPIYEATHLARLIAEFLGLTLTTA